VKLLKLKKYPVRDLILGYLVTVGLDGDHLFDYFMINNWSHFNLKEFLSGYYFETADQIFVLFHAWEWVAFCVLLFLLFKKKYKVILFIAVGIAAQLIFDTVSHGFDWQAYFITNRYLHNFDKTIFISRKLIK